MNKNKLADKVILVLGGTGDIGSAVADLLEADGATVCKHGLSGDYGADVRDGDQTRRLVEGIVSRLGRIDVVINALSAPIKIAPVFKKDWSSFLDHFSVQLRAVVDVVQAITPQMKLQKNGCFVNILSSVVKGEPPSSYADYVTAKYAMLGFSKCLFKELGHHGVKITCVSPDFVLTKLTAEFPSKLGKILASKNSSKRLTQPKDVAALMKRIIYDSGSYDGKNVIMSGGRVIASVNLID